jgi:FAD/FMN-containing dehydrogenase
MSSETFHAAREQLAPQTMGAYESRAASFGPFTATFERVPAGFPPGGAELYEGLPDCACQVPHWGFVFKGKIAFEHAGGREQVISAGEAYYVAPGHRWKCLEDAETIEFSPALELEAHWEVVAANLAHSAQGSALDAMAADAHAAAAVPIDSERDRTEIEALGHTFSGALIRPTDAGYEDARQIWNAMIDRRPGLIARCRSVDDVQNVVEFARHRRALLSVRGGGHNIAGNAVCDAGIVLDLSEMRTVKVDVEARLAVVEGGATLADLDRATQAYGLATPLGINSTTGVGGLTLGGGFGWLSRKYGLTVDNLLAAEVVTADGGLIRASEVDDAELFWALRGGGGNFGVVTRFELRLHPVGPQVLCGLVVYSAEHADEVLRRYREQAAALPEETSAWAVLRSAPPLPFLDAAAHGQPALILAILHCGSEDAGRRALEPLRRLAAPLGEQIGMMPYVAWQQAFDPLLAPGARNYWKSHNFVQLDDGLIDVLVRSAQMAPSPHCEIFVGQLGGATERIAPDATAYPHRDARYVINVHGRWESADQDDTGIAWARSLYRDAAPFSTGGVYVNFLTADESERVRAAYGGNYERLRAAKRRYDPANLFRMNQNIPAASRIE